MTTIMTTTTSASRTEVWRLMGDYLADRAVFAPPSAATLIHDRF